MEYFLFFLNILLTIALATSLASAYYLYRTRGGGVFVALIVLFLLYLFDNTIVFMTETIDSFAIIYDRFFISSPVAKAVFHIGIIFCYYFIHKQVLREKLSSPDFVLIIMYTLLLFTVQLIPDAATSSWAFYAPNSIFCGGLAVYGLTHMRRFPQRYRRTFYKFYKRLCIFIVIMCVLILAEDTYVIFNVDVYSASNPAIFNRNITENTMMFFFSIFLISYTRFVLLRHDLSVLGAETVPASHVISTMDAFCRLYSLTDREREILNELLAGYSTVEISEKLYISSGTVKTHIHNLYRKAEVGRKNELIRKYTDFEDESGKEQVSSQI